MRWRVDDDGWTYYSSHAYAKAYAYMCEYAHTHTRRHNSTRCAHACLADLLHIVISTRRTGAHTHIYNNNSHASL